MSVQLRDADAKVYAPLNRTSLQPRQRAICATVAAGRFAAESPLACAADEAHVLAIKGGIELKPSGTF